MKEIEIPEGYEARIEGNKVIIELEENKDERIRKDIIALIEFGVSKGSVVTPFSRTTKDEALAYLEKQKEHKSAKEVLIMAGLKPFKDGNQWCFLYGNNIQEGVAGFGDTIESAARDFYVNIRTEIAKKEE